jgi:hypothetical protein
MIGLCLVAVFAIAAVAATSASALPEWGKCTAKAGGKYLDSNCTKKGSLKNPGSFEWTKGKELAPVKFTGSNVGSGGVLVSKFLVCSSVAGKSKFEGIRRYSRSQCIEEGGELEEEPEAISIECESETNHGEAVSTNKLANITVTFLGCKVFGSIPCSNSSNEGEIIVNTLKGQLGYINKAAKEVGVLLTPAKSKGEFAKFSCGGVLATVVGVGNVKEGAYWTPEKTGGYDGIISPITPVNTMTSKYTQVFTVNESTYQNIPSKFEGKHIELLEDTEENIEGGSILWVKAGEEITNVNTAAEPGEIKG